VHCTFIEGQRWVEVGGKMSESKACLFRDISEMGNCKLLPKCEISLECCIL
jgi:hypothetical protein